MSYSNIKRVLSVALLCAFAVPSSLAVAAEYNSYGTDNSAAISGDVVLTQKNDLITLSLRDSDVKQVLRMFADKAGMNIIFHSSVEGKVTLDLVQTPVNQAFNMVLQIAGLNYYKQGNTMIVMSKDSPDNATYSKQDMMTFPVKYVSAAKIADFLNKNVFGMKRPGLSGGDAATVNSATNEIIVFGMPSDAAIVKKVIEQFDREPYSKTFVVNHTTPAEMANMICSFLLPSSGIMSGDSGQQTGSPADAAVTGGAASVSDSSSSSSSSIKIGEGIVACSVSSSASGSSGSVAPFDMQNLAVAYFPQRGTVSLMGGSESQIAMVERFIKKNDVKQPQAMLEVSIVELNEEGSKEFSNTWNASIGSFSFSADDGSTKIDSRKVGGDSKFDVHWAMNYLISNKKARVLANPKILITNGQESVIDLTQDYIEKVTSEYLNSAGGSGTVGVAQKTYTIGEDLGIKVSLTPFISPDGYVTLNIKPDYTTVAGKEYATGETGDDDLVATLLKRRNLDLKNIRIKDGETFVIGGLLQESDEKTVKKIPILGDLPMVGAAFRSTQSTQSKTELVLMLTPKIINDGEGAVADSL